MKLTHIKYLLISGLMLFVVSCGVKPNATETFEISGPCSECSADIPINLVKGLNGVAEVTYDEKEKNLTVQFDSTIVTKVNIITALNEIGYEVDLQMLVSAKSYSDCCNLEEADDEDISLDDEDLELQDLDFEIGEIDLSAELEDIEADADDALKDVEIDDEDLKELNLD